MHNLPVDKATAPGKVTETAGATLLYLPPYSPDFDRTEQAFSKLKAYLSKAPETTLRAGPVAF